MAKQTTVVWASFPTHEAAEAIRDRLTANGFARNSIEIYRQGHGEGCDVAVHTTEQNLRRVERLLNSSAPVYALRRVGTGALQAVASHPFVIGGVVALAGAVLYSLLPRNRASTIQSLRELPRTVAGLPEAFKDAAGALPGRPGTVPDPEHRTDVDVNDGRGTRGTAAARSVDHPRP